MLARGRKSSSWRQEDWGGWSEWHDHGDHWHSKGWNDESWRYAQAPYAGRWSAADDTGHEQWPKNDTSRSPARAKVRLKPASKEAAVDRLSRERNIGKELSRPPAACDSHHAHDTSVESETLKHMEQTKTDIGLGSAGTSTSEAEQQRTTAHSAEDLLDSRRQHAPPLETDAARAHKKESTACPAARDCRMSDSVLPARQVERLEEDGSESESQTSSKSSHSSGSVNKVAKLRRPRQWDIQPTIDHHQPTPAESSPCSTSSDRLPAEADPASKLQVLLQMATSLKRCSVAEVMCFCLENACCARQLAAQMANEFTRSSGPFTMRELSCLLCVSDVLHNTHYSHRFHGAGDYRSAFEAALPGVFRRIHAGICATKAVSASSHAFFELRLRQILEAWRKTEVLPMHFLDGLEAVGIGGILSNLKGDGCSGVKQTSRTEDSSVRSRMKEYSNLTSSALERKCREKGLFMHAASREAMLQRLHAFEEYWSSSRCSRLPSVWHVATNAEENIDGVPLHSGDVAATVERHMQKTAISSNASTAAVEKTQDQVARMLNPQAVELDEDIDGEPIGILDLLRWREAKAAVAAAAQRSTQMMTQRATIETPTEPLGGTASSPDAFAIASPHLATDAAHVCFDDVEELLSTERRRVHADADAKSRRRRRSSRSTRRRRRDRGHHEAVSLDAKRRKKEAAAAAAAASAAASAAAFFAARSRACTLPPPGLSGNLTRLAPVVGRPMLPESGPDADLDGDPWDSEEEETLKDERVRSQVPLT